MSLMNSFDSQSSTGPLFRCRSNSSVVQLAGIKTAVEKLSAARLKSSQDATIDRSSLLHTSSYSTPKKKTPERRGTLGKSFRSFLKRDSSPSTSSPKEKRSDFFINDLQKSSLTEIKFDLLITQIQNSNAAWLNGFVNNNGGGYLLQHLTEENYSDAVKNKFLPCLRCFHSLVNQCEDANLGNLMDSDSFLNLIQILVWTKDLFLLSSTCMTLLDISKSLYGHLHLMQALSRAKEQFLYRYSTYPFVCALHLIKSGNSESKDVRICSEVVLTLINTFIMGIHEISERFVCENEFLGQGVLPILLDLHSFGNLQGQLDLFEQIITADYDQMKGKDKTPVITQKKVEMLTTRSINANTEHIIKVTLTPDSTIEELIDVITVKQEYLGFTTHSAELYGLFIEGNSSDQNYIKVIGKVQLQPFCTVSDYSLDDSTIIDLQLLPLKLSIIDTFHNNNIISILVNPNKTLDDILGILLNCNNNNNNDNDSEDDSEDCNIIIPSCEIIEGFSITESDNIFTGDIEYGLFCNRNQSWLRSSSPIISLKEFQDNIDTVDLYLAAKIPPLIIKYKGQTFNMNLLSNNITIEQVLEKIAKQVELQEDQISKYALFIDDGNQIDDEPAKGLLESTQTIYDILEEKNLECLTLKFSYCPQYLKILISDDSLMDRNNPGSYRILVLLNRPVLDGIDAICKVTGHNPANQQLTTLMSDKLIEDQSFESQNILEDSELLLCLREDEPDEMENDVNFWDEECNNETFRTEVENGNTIVTAATLNQLIKKATDEDEYDSNFLEAFLATYRSFTTPTMLLQKLFQRFNVPDNIPEQTKKIVQMRVCVVLKRWLSSFNDEAEIQLIDKIKTWIYSQSEDLKILNGIKSALNKKRSDVIDQFYFKSKPPIPKLPKEKTLEFLTFLDLDMIEVARQLCLVEFEMFHKLRPTELFGQPWSRPKTQHLCPNLMQLVTHFNYISKAVASLIVTEPKVRIRAKIFERLISLAEHLRNMNNFNLLIAVVSGLNNSGVGRLKYTKERVSTRSMILLQNLEELTSMNQSYKNYRNLLTENSEPPLIPYLGVYLQDLTFIEDGNPDKIDDLINFSKCILVRKILSQIATFQQEAYNFVKVPLIKAFLEDLPQLDDDKIYKLSLQIEPRNAQVKDIE